MLHKAFTVYMYLVENVYLYTDCKWQGALELEGV